MNFKIEELNLGLIDLPDEDPANGRLSALLQIAECFKGKRLPSEALMAYFIASVEALATKHAKIDPAVLPADTVMEKRQRAISSAFGYTRGAGKPKADNVAEYRIAKDIYRTMQRQKCTDDIAIEHYMVDDTNPEKYHASFEHLRKLYYKYKPLLLANDAEEAESRLRGL